MEDVELMRYYQMVLQLNVIPLESTFVVQNMVTVETLMSIVTVQIVLITGTRMPKVICLLNIKIFLIYLKFQF